jgi:tetratricopeptide (TPR) repeat protein
VFRMLAVFVTLLSSVQVLAQVPAPKKTPPTSEQIQQAVKDLGHARFAVREQAIKSLWEMGRVAEPALREASKSSDEEVVTRARFILDKYDWGIYPDTPDEILKLIAKYQGGEAPVRVETIQALLKLKPLPMATLRKLLAQEKEPETRDEIFADLGLRMRQIIPQMILRDELDEATELLEICIASPYGRYDFASLIYLRGQLEPTIKKYEKLLTESKGEETKKHAETLMHLARLKKDWPSARRYAVTAGNPEFPDMIAWESSDWKALAEDKNQNRPRDYRSAQATFYRMAGEKAKYNEMLDEMRKELAGVESNDETALELARTLLLNGKGGEAVNLLRDRTKDGADLVFDLLCAQLKYREAFAYADKALKEKAEEGDEEDRGFTKTMLNLRRARTLALLGDRDSAIQLFRQISDQAIDAQQIQVLVGTLSILKRLGEKDLATDIMGKCLNHITYQRQEVLFPLMEVLYGDDQFTVYIWWKAANSQAKLPQDRLALLKSILEKKANEKTLDALAAQIEATVKSISSKEPMVEEGAAGVIDSNRPSIIRLSPSSYYQAIAVAYDRGGHIAKAEKYYKKSCDTINAKSYETILNISSVRSREFLGTTDFSLTYADFLFRQKRYEEAAKRFQASTENNPANPLTLYLQGESLSKAGQVEEGKKLMEKAHWVALGDESARFKFSEELNKRGFGDASRRETKFIVDTAWFHSYEVGNAYLRHARHLVRERKFNEAADLFEKDVASLFRTGATFMDGSAYLHVPEQARTYRIKALFNAGKREEAFALAREGMEAMPNNVDLVIGFVPELDRAGRKQEADEFYGRLKKTYEAGIKDYPNSPELRNSLAWTMVNCNRDLSEARLHAEKAVAQSPKSASYLDTLAEIRFRQQDRAAALEMMKRCSLLEPSNPYYRKQLERFEKKPFDSPPPDEETGDE